MRDEGEAEAEAEPETVVNAFDIPAFVDRWSRRNTGT
jgi:hypothetical protein